MSATASASPKAQGGQARQPSQGPRVNNGAQPGARKAQNGSPKPDGARRSPQPSAANGKQAQSKAAPKAKASPSMSDFLRQRGATIETANMVSQLRADLGNYYSEEAVYNALVSNSNNVEATRASLTQSKETSWASKVSPVASRMAEPIPAPAVIAHAQQTGARRRIKTSQPQKSASPSEATPAQAAPSAPEPAVDPEQMQKSIESALQATQTQAQELLGLQSTVNSVRTAQTELTSEKETLLQRIAQREAEIAQDRARIQQIDSTLAEHKGKLADLHKTISQKTAKQ